MIDLLKLAGVLEEMHCRPAALSGQWEGFSFDIVAGSPKNAVLLKCQSLFDDRSARDIETTYSELCTKSSGWLLGKRFQLVVLAETVDIDIQQYFDWSERLRKTAAKARLYDMKSGGGNVFVVDLKNKEILPRSKWFPQGKDRIFEQLQEFHLNTPWGRAVSKCW
jgi:hypothetical protein